MNLNEFTDYCKLSISSEKSGLRQPSVEDIKHWTELGLFKHALPYYHEDISIAMGILRHEKDIREHLVAPERKVKPTASSLASLVQVITCIGATPTEEGLIVDQLKETGHISFAGWIGINCHPISWRPMEKPGGDLLLITTKTDPGVPPPKGVLTPWGHRLLFDKTDKNNKVITLVSSPGEKAFRVMPPRSLSLPLEKGGAEASSSQAETKEYVTIPIMVPAIKVEGMGLALVHLSYLTQDNRRIPALVDREKFPDRLYAEFLNVDSSSPTAITTFLIKYGISLRFEKKEDSLTDTFLSTKEQFRQIMEMSQSNRLDAKTLEQLASPHEVASIDAELVSQLASSNEYADFAWHCWQWSQKSQGTKQSLIPVTRFHSWENYLRWEILNDIIKGRLPRMCKSCGNLLLTTETGRGRPLEYCERCRSLSYRAKDRERVRRYREGKKATRM